MPIDSLTSGGIEAWVIVAGCSTRLSTPPKLSASVKIFKVERNFFVCLKFPLMQNEIIPPCAGCLFFANSILRVAFETWINDKFNT